MSWVNISVALDCRQPLTDAVIDTMAESAAEQVRENFNGVFRLAMQFAYDGDYPQTDEDVEELAQRAADWVLEVRGDFEDAKAGHDEWQAHFDAWQRQHATAP